MATSSPVALILGAGANVGQHVGRALAAKGYKIAFAARSAKEEDSTPTQLLIRGDFADPTSIASIFEKVKSQLGPPQVVVYNGLTQLAPMVDVDKDIDLSKIAAAVTINDANDPLSLTLDNFTRHLAVNTTGAFAAAQQAIIAFGELPNSAPRTFIYTGNCLNVAPMVQFLDLGVGKSATAYIIQVAAEAYASKGYRFYYADQRQADGSPANNNIDGPAHAELYAQLVETGPQGPWQQTFVKGQGYTKF
ncbi:hypothetical protein NM208_g401 [Fusarium decemcellulare]|uniref:Uncharacterized protein n=2 Tax=Fusarium decemcellulare TaxID=57161 RepID=A0ACC1SMG1_9HYPO|nr:hypothetical protein NM208_g3912 [Fusarium decemcellulare]KAJ3549673.1 hypothetical protein NM208_g401 [Fusarium decemcellulare]